MTIPDTSLPVRRLALFVGGPFNGEVRPVPRPGPVLFHGGGADLLAWEPDFDREDVRVYEMQRHLVGDGVIDVYVAPDVTRSELGAAVFEAIVAEPIRAAFRRAPADPCDSRDPS